MHRRILLMALVVASSPHVSRAQWDPNGVAIVTAAFIQRELVSVADGAGGAIFAWADFRNGASNIDIFVQRVDASGVPLWAVDGVAVCTAVGNQMVPTIVADGAGGAIIAWHDFRPGPFDAEIYAQRVNAQGTPLWFANGVPLSIAVSNQTNPKAVADGSGGAIVVWEDARSGPADVYAQRVNAAGSTQWTFNGVALSTAASTQLSLVAASDGAGGAIVAWEDQRNGDNDLYARRVNASGVPQWIANGAAICTAPNAQFGCAIASDGAGGAILAWSDNRNGGGADLFAQRVDASGASLWTANGILICNQPGDQLSAAIMSYAVGGTILAWVDYRNASNYAVYVQRVSATGVPQWTPDGVAISTSVIGDQYVPRLASDGSGGAIVVWTGGGTSTFNVYAQRLSAYGAPQWASEGITICAAADEQIFPVLVSSGDASIMAWLDDRSGGDDIYAQRIENVYGFWGHPEPIIDSVEDIPHDQGGKVAIDWTASGRDLPSPRAIDFYSVWRAVDAVSMSANVISSSDLSTLSKDDVGPVYLATPSRYFERVGTQSAHGWPGYSFAADTRSDSTLASDGDGIFMIAAHYLYDSYVAFPSNEASGHSVDNLAPAAPLLLSAQRVGTDVQLHWNRAVAPDLRDYAVYRATSSGVTPVPINFLASAEDTVATDANAPSSALYYIVTAYDVHANQSDPSNEAHVGSLTGIGNLPSVTALTVLQNHPNPFTATTEFQIGLPESGDVRVDVFDVAGRRVMTMDAKGVKGWQRIPFAARDQRGRSLASGVYFARVSAAGKTITKKMVIAR